MSLSDLSSMAKMSVVGGRERLALLCLAGVKGGSGLEFQLNTSYMDEDIRISANKPLNAATLGTFQLIYSSFSFCSLWQVGRNGRKHRIYNLIDHEKGLIMNEYIIISTS